MREKRDGCAMKLGSATFLLAAKIKSYNLALSIKTYHL